MTYPYAATRCAICSASAVSCSARNATSRPTTSCDGTTDSSNDHSRKQARCFGGVPTMVFPWIFGSSPPIRRKRSRNFPRSIDHIPRIWILVACWPILDSRIMLKDAWRNGSHRMSWAKLRSTRICPSCKSPDISIVIKRQMLGFVSVEHWICHDCGLIQQFKKSKKRNGKY